MVSVKVSEEKGDRLGVTITDYSTGQSLRTDTRNGRVVSRRLRGGGGTRNQLSRAEALRLKEIADLRGYIKSQIGSSTSIPSDLNALRAEKERIQKERGESISQIKNLRQGRGSKLGVNENLTLSQLKEKLGEERFFETRSESRVSGTPEPNAVFAGASNLPTREEEKSTFTSLGSAFKTSFGRATTPSTIGEQGLGNYWKGIFEPFNRVGGKRTTPNKNLPYETRGTQVSEDFKTKLDYDKMSLGEIAVTESILGGESFEMSRVGTDNIGDVLAGKAGDKAQRELDKQTNSLTSEIQGKIDRGTITYEEGKNLFDKRSGELQQKIEDKYSKQLQADFGSAISRRGSSDRAVSGASSQTDFGSKAKFLVEQGAIIGATGSSSIPLRVGASAFFLGSGQKNVARGALGTDLSAGRRLGLVGLGVGEGLIGGAVARSAIGLNTPKSLISKQNVAEIQSELNRKPFTISGKEVYRGKEGQLFKITGSRSVGSGTQVVTSKVPVFPTAKGGVYQISGGKAFSKTSVYDFFSGRTFKGSEIFNINARVGSSAVTSIGRRGSPIKLTDKQLTGGVGSGLLTSKTTGKVTPFRITGAEKTKGGVSNVFDITPKKVGRNVVSGSGVRISGNLQGVGQIKLLGGSTGSSGSGFTIIKGGGAKTSFAQTFSKQIAPPSFSTSLTKSAGATSIRTLQSQSPRATRIFATTISGQSLGLENKQKSPTLTSTRVGTNLKSDYNFRPSVVNVPKDRIRYGTGSGTGVKTNVGTGLQQKTSLNFGRATESQIVAGVNSKSGFSFGGWIPSLSPDFNTKTRKRDFFGKQKTAFVPSFQALAFNIKGKKRSRGKSGLRFAPVPEGFSITNVFNEPKKRKRRKKK